MSERQAIMRQLDALNDEYEMVMGYPAFLHTASVDGHTMYHFIGGVITDTAEDALTHMKAMLSALAHQFARGE